MGINYPEGEMNLGRCGASTFTGPGGSSQPAITPPSPAVLAGSPAAARLIPLGTSAYCSLFPYSSAGSPAAAAVVGAVTLPTLLLLLLFILLLM